MAIRKENLYIRKSEREDSKNERTQKRVLKINSLFPKTLFLFFIFMANAKTTSSARESAILKAVQSIASYNDSGIQALRNAYDILDEYLPKELTFDQFSESIDRREVNDFEFMYDSESDTWADDRTMIEWGKENLPII